MQGRGAQEVSKLQVSFCTIFISKAIVCKTRAMLIKISILATSLYSDGEKGKAKNLVSDSEEMPETW